eukprot:11200122-Lingulodinium_polyedra.AAC.1
MFCYLSSVAVGGPAQIRIAHIFPQRRRERYSPCCRSRAPACPVQRAFVPGARRASGAWRFFPRRMQLRLD